MEQKSLAVELVAVHVAHNAEAEPGTSVLMADYYRLVFVVVLLILDNILLLALVGVMAIAVVSIPDKLDIRYSDVVVFPFLTPQQQELLLAQRDYLNIHNNIFRMPLALNCPIETSVFSMVTDPE